MPQEFKVGMVVRLKCGGPFMTVSEAHEDGVMVLWYSEGINEYTVPPEVLEIIDIELETKKAESMIIHALQKQIGEGGYSN